MINRDNDAKLNYDWKKCKVIATYPRDVLNYV